MHSFETRDDAFEVTTTTGCASALLILQLRFSAKSERTISSSKAAGDSAGPQPFFFELTGAPMKGEKVKVIQSPGKSVERRRDFSGSDFKDAKSDAWAELGRRFQVAHDPATSSGGIVFARTRSNALDRIARARSNARDSKGALRAPNSSTDVLPWSASWEAKRRASQP